MTVNLDYAEVWSSGLGPAWQYYDIVESPPFHGAVVDLPESVVARWRACRAEMRECQAIMHSAFRKARPV